MGVVDGEDAELGAAPRVPRPPVFFALDDGEVDVFDAGAAGDDDRDVSPPVWEPRWGPFNWVGAAGASL